MKPTRGPLWLKCLLVFIIAAGALFLFSTSGLSHWPPTSREWIVSIGGSVVAGALALLWYLDPSAAFELFQTALELKKGNLEAGVAVLQSHAPLNFSPPAPPSLEERVIAALVRGGMTEGIAFAMVQDNLQAAASFAGIKE